MSQATSQATGIKWKNARCGACRIVRTDTEKVNIQNVESAIGEQRYSETIGETYY